MLQSCTTYLVIHLPVFSNHTRHFVCAAANGCIDTVKLLLGKPGITVDGRDLQGKTALIESIDHGRYDIAKLLLDAGADIRLW